MTWSFRTRTPTPSPRPYPADGRTPASLIRTGARRVGDQRAASVCSCSRAASVGAHRDGEPEGRGVSSAGVARVRASDCAGEDAAGPGDEAGDAVDDDWGDGTDDEAGGVGDEAPAADAGGAAGCGADVDAGEVPDGGGEGVPSARASPRARRASVTAAAPARPSQDVDSKTRVTPAGSVD